MTSEKRFIWKIEIFDVRQARGVIVPDHLETLQAMCAQFVPNFQNLCPTFRICALTVRSLGMTSPTWRQARGLIFNFGPI